MSEEKVKGDDGITRTTEEWLDFIAETMMGGVSLKILQRSFKTFIEAAKGEHFDPIQHFNDTVVGGDTDQQRLKEIAERLAMPAESRPPRPFVEKTREDMVKKFETRYVRRKLGITEMSPTEQAGEVVKRYVMEVLNQNKHIESELIKLGKATDSKRTHENKAHMMGCLLVDYIQSKGRVPRRREEFKAFIKDSGMNKKRWFLDTSSMSQFLALYKMAKVCRDNKPG